MEKLANSRITAPGHVLADEFNTSLPVDKRMYAQDIFASIAHATMLEKCGIISPDEGKKIKEGLNSVYEDIKNGVLEMKDAEDIHMFVEEELTKRIGNAGKKLHTARSRNDQVVTDFKMYIKDANTAAIEKIKGLIGVILNISSKNLKTYMPGFTHMQKAQPVTLAFHLTAYAQMFLRDIERFSDCYKRADVCPLGSGALAGTTYPIDRKLTASLCGFSSVTENAMDAVSDRDYAAEYIFAATMTMTHLSRLAEEVIIWASDEYRFITLSDAFSTGSSIMPQKKNPDMAELVRGKSGRVIGNLVAMVTILKGLPLAYNKDMQEDKDLVFQTEEILLKSLAIFAPMLETATFNAQIMKKSASKGYTNATDFADYLAVKGIPFREAHGITGKLVLYCIENSINIEDTPLNKLKEFSPAVEIDVFDFLKMSNVVARRNLIGGTAPEAVKKQIKSIQKKLLH